MPGRKRSEVPASFLRVGQRFAAWRKTRGARQRIPEPLWTAAVKMAVEHGLNRTASFLNLDYYSLKKRVEGASGQVEPTFVELPSSSLSMMSECVIEFENATGARLRVHLKGQNTPDLLALSRSFWNAD